MKPTVDRLRELVSYDPETGAFTRLTTVGGRQAGMPAGGSSSKGYWQMSFDGKIVEGHQVAWALHYGTWPDTDLDHRNGDKQDNRIVNLRPASKSQNMFNQRLSKANTSGAKGVYPNGRGWKTLVGFYGKRYWAYGFPSKEHAQEFRELAAEMLHGAFVNHGAPACK